MNYRTAWLVHNKIMQAIKERDGAYVLRGKVQVDDAYLGGERCDGKPGRGSKNKVPIVAAVSIDDAGHPRYVKLATVTTFSFAAIADWAQDSLAIGCSDLRWAGLLSRRHRRRLPASSCGRERSQSQ